MAKNPKKSEKKAEKNAAPKPEKKGEARKIEPAAKVTIKTLTVEGET